MSFGMFLMAVGTAGSAFLVGVIVRSVGLRPHVPGVGLWLILMIAMGGIAALASASRPVIHPIGLQYLLLLGCPFLAGFVGLSLLVRTRQKG